MVWEGLDCSAGVRFDGGKVRSKRRICIIVKCKFSSFLSIQRGGFTDKGGKEDVQYSYRNKRGHTGCTRMLPCLVHPRESVVWH